jgi:V8-like Glu-specific endopeptidase
MRIRTDSRWTIAAMLASLTLLFAAFAMPLRLNAAQGAVGIANTDEAATDAYWTADRLQNVKPMPLPRASVLPQATAPESAPVGSISLPGAAPTEQVESSSLELFTPLIREGQLPESASIMPDAYGSIGLRFTSARLMTNAGASIGAEKQYPYAIEGQLSFTIPSGTTCETPGNYVCSATVQRPGIITTAGHCVSDGNGHFYKNWVFVPATRNGSAPFGKWTWKYAAVTNTWFSGSCSVPNAQDVAAIVLKRNSAANLIGVYTGYAGFNIPDLYSGQHLTVLGYPCNLDSCAKDHRTDAQAIESDNNTDILGSDAGGGASGGGWIVNYGEYAKGQPVSGASDTIGNELVAVTSYGPTTAGVLYLGASVLDSGYVQCTPLATCSTSPTALLNFVCQKYPNSC